MEMGQGTEPYTNKEGSLTNEVLIQLIREHDRQLSQYYVWELEYVDSNDEEYKRFIDKYFSVIQVEAEYACKEENGLDVFRFGKDIENNKTILFQFCQTCKSKGLPISKSKSGIEDNYGIEQSYYGLDYHTDIYYSKDNKYLMYLDGDAEYSFAEYLYYIKTFCELN